jgi:hypothetical protein
VRLKIIGCEIVFREVAYLAAKSKNIVDLAFMPKGLHDIETERMRQRIQAEIDKTDPKIVETIALAYGLCNNGIMGLEAKEIPIVVPRAHDCITFFFGSKERYMEYFLAHSGTYFRTTGWSERKSAAELDGKIMSQLGLDRTFEEYKEKYGEEAARYITEVMGSWKKNYSRLCYIAMGIAEHLRYDEKAREEANEKGWQFERREGDSTLLERLLNGPPWDEEDFLILKPGQSLIATHKDDIIAARDKE